MAVATERTMEWPRFGAWRRWAPSRYDHQQERGFDFWVLRDPWGNEFCVL